MLEYRVGELKEARLPRLMHIRTRTRHPIRPLRPKNGSHKEVVSEGKEPISGPPRLNQLVSKKKHTLVIKLTDTESRSLLDLNN